jgi:putative NADPH-quinone reductase
MTAGRRIAVILGHPDAEGGHLCHALAEAYGRGAKAGGHEVREIAVAGLEFPWIRNRDDFVSGERPPDILEVQETIRWAEHLVVVYPLWQGTMPALLKAFIEQVFRYDFAFEPQPNGRFEKKLTGRSARIVVTMGMPALAYRFYFRAHSLKSLERNILGFAGIKPIRETLLGGVETASAEKRQGWIGKLEDLGRKGA